MTANSTQNISSIANTLLEFVSSSSSTGSTDSNAPSSSNNNVGVLPLGSFITVMIGAGLFLGGTSLTIYAHKKANQEEQRMNGLLNARANAGAIAVSIIEEREAGRLEQAPLMGSYSSRFWKKAAGVGCAVAVAGGLVMLGGGFSSVPCKDIDGCDGGKFRR